MRPHDSLRAAVVGSVLAGSLLAGALPAFGQALDDHTYTAEAVEAGSRIYTSQCALCHGPNGNGVNGINLRAGRFRTAVSDDDLRRVISIGAGGGQMPAFDLGEDGLNGIVAYIRARFDPTAVAVRVGDAARGAAIFQGPGGCIGCHQVNGMGSRTGPDLSEIGSVRTPERHQQTLLDPDAVLLPINRPVRIMTSGGEIVSGRRLNEDTYTVQLIDSNERLRSFEKSDLRSYEVRETATMRPTTMTGDQLADVIGYLLTLRGQP